jgi:hypothetical protein
MGDTDERKGKESRKYLRFQIDDASTSFAIKGVSTALGEGKVSRGRASINLSEGGTLLLVSDTVPVGAAVTVRIEMEGYGEFVEAGGIVKWCEPSGRNEKDFRAGIEFVELSENDLRKISRMREWLSAPEQRNRGTTQRRT